MPIGIMSDEQLEEELSRHDKTYETARIQKVIRTPVSQIIDIPSKGRSEGDTNVPDSLRQIIGEEAVINGRQSALGLAGMFGISPSSVSAYAKGATSTTSYDSPKPSIIDHINKSRRRAIKRASNTLNSALSAISQEKLDYADAKDLSTIAKDMSVVIKNLEPPTAAIATTGDTSPQFVIFAPQFRQENSFDTITVSE